MIVRIGKIHSLTRAIHTDTRCLGRRLHIDHLSLGRRLPVIIGIIGISRVFQTFTVVLQTSSYLQFIYKFLHTNTYVQIKTLKYLWSHQLQSWYSLSKLLVSSGHHRQVPMQGERKMELVQDSSFILIYALVFIKIWQNTLV